MRRGLSVLAWAAALLHLACGRVDYPGGDGDGSTASSLECFDGELRLSATPCDTGEFLVERCEAEVWSTTEECRVPEVPCNEGEVVETEELCGEYETIEELGGMRDYNRVLEGCRGGVRQKVGCTCGAEAPTPRPPIERNGIEYGPSLEYSPEQEGKLQGQILGIEGVTYAGLLWFPSTKVKTDLNQVLCVGKLMVGGGAPEMSGLTAVNALEIRFPYFAYNSEPVVVPPLPALRKLYSVWIRGGDEVELSGLQSLTKLEKLTISTPGSVDLSGLRNLRELDLLEVGDASPVGITSLEGLEGITRASYIGVNPENTSTFEVPALLNYSGLKNLEYVEGVVAVRRSIEGLKGLENLRSVGNLDADIVDEADIDVLANLEEVRGDLDLHLEDDRLRCSVPRLLDHVTVSGTITVDGFLWEDIRSRCEE